MNKIAIFASGDGTTAEAFIIAGAKKLINTQAGLVICNNPGAGIFDRVTKLNKQFGLEIKTELINSKTHPANSNEKTAIGHQTLAEEKAIVSMLLAGNFDLVVLMGYLKHISPNLVKQFGWKNVYTSSYQAMMLNTHPGLLPETKGLYGRHIQQYVIDKKIKVAGQTLNVVAEKYDDGPIVAEHKLDVLSSDTAESLFDRIRTIEKQFLPKDVDNFIKNRQNYLKGKEAK